MKVSELDVEQLDYQVALALGADPKGYPADNEKKCGVCMTGDWDNRGRFRTHLGSGWSKPWNPSVDWDQGGPIIEREKISFYPEGNMWFACKDLHVSGPDHDLSFDGDFFESGPTPLVAAMRCFVASKLGAEASAT